ncbi:hypothetical protein [Bdellovibrio bacteriovorus]|uniref:hypothetical protein n=1 Tax=Bdellovibrio bacteriovorus TaxID=959 RepID=UPI0012F7626C|nr:hypothetical protein [Bdellovibrio bacteriovorus]
MGSWSSQSILKGELMKLPTPGKPVNAAPSQNPNKVVLNIYATLDIGVIWGFGN